MSDLTPTNQDLNYLINLINRETRKAKQVREIVPIHEWLENEFYVGEDGLNLYDYWKSEIEEFHKTGLTEWILFGSLGAGKTTAAVFAMIRKIYELSCYEPIPYIFQLMKSSVIYFIYFSISLTLAKRTGYGKFIRVIDSIPYFQKYYKRDLKVESELKFQNMSIVYGSSVSHQIGVDLLGCLLDEGDFYETKTGTANTDGYSAARDIYTSTTNRRKLRFAVKGKDSGISILISSPAYGTDFVEKRIESAERKGTAYITRTVGYEILRSKHAIEEFYVFPGTEDVDPAILDTVDDVRTVSESMGIEINESDWNEPFDDFIDLLEDYEIEVYKVPVNLREPFEEDLLKAVRDVLGKSLRAIGSYMDEKSLAPCRRIQLKHPFKKAVISLSTKNDIRIEDYLIESRLGPKEVPRFVHIDQSVTTDRTGMACSYLEEDAVDNPYPLVRLEWMLAISPPAIGEIPIIRCCEFIVFLRDMGYQFCLVTMDSFQSRASLQHLTNEGIPCELLSVDKDDEAYVNVRNLIHNKKLLTYDYSIYTREMVNLVWDRSRHKIDHTPSGSKDVADAGAGSVHNAIIHGPSFPTVESLSVRPEENKEEQTLNDLLNRDDIWDDM